MITEKDLKLLYNYQEDLRKATEVSKRALDWGSIKYPYLHAYKEDATHFNIQSKFSILWHQLYKQNCQSLRTKLVKDTVSKLYEGLAHDIEPSEVDYKILDILFDEVHFPKGKGPVWDKRTIDILRDDVRKAGFSRLCCHQDWP